MTALAEADTYRFTAHTKGDFQKPQFSEITLQ